MTYAISAHLQAGIYTRLTTDPTVASLVGDAIYDAAPSGSLPTVYVMLGEERVRDRSDKDAGGAAHDFTVSVVSDAPGFQTAKRAAAAVSDALLHSPLTLTRGHVTGIWFRRAQAARVGTGDQRRIDLRFRAQVQDDQP